MRPGVSPQDLSTNQFDAPYTASCVLSEAVSCARRGRPTSQLHLPTGPALQEPFVLDGGTQGWAAVQGAHGDEDLGHAVVGKHGDLVNVAELAPRLALEAGPEVGDEDLGAFEEADGLGSPIEVVLVAEARKVAGQQVDETGRAGVGGGDYIDEGAIIPLGTSPELVRY